MKEQLIMPTMILELELELELDRQQNISFGIQYMVLGWKWTPRLEQGHQMIAHLLIRCTRLRTCTWKINYITLVSARPHIP